MRAPHLNRALTLEEREGTPDGSGGYIDNWSSLGTLWAELKGIGGRDRSVDAVALSEARFKVTVRSAPAGSTERPSAGQRFRDGSRVFPILAVVDADPLGQWLTCYVREEVAR